MGFLTWALSHHFIARLIGVISISLKKSANENNRRAGAMTESLIDAVRVKLDKRRKGFLLIARDKMVFADLCPVRVEAAPPAKKIAAATALASGRALADLLRQSIPSKAFA